MTTLNIGDIIRNQINDCDFVVTQVNADNSFWAKPVDPDNKQRYVSLTSIWHGDTSRIISRA